MLSELLAWGPTTRFQPDAQLTTLQDSQALYDRLARLVGYVAFGLPVLLIIGGLVSACFRDSISHFYYAQFWGSVFVGCLIFIGGFLYVYQGENKFEIYGSTCAGAGAVMVALLPTSQTGCEMGTTFKARAFNEFTLIEWKMVDDARVEVFSVNQPPGPEAFQLFEAVNWFHLGGAATVFLFLAFYCMFVMSRIVEHRHKPEGFLIASKRQRNIIYKICGLTILACLGALGAKFLVGKNNADFLNWWNLWNLTFWFETLALWAFGLSWMIKGRWFTSLNDA